ncbi:MAG TPA: hypothetical protein VET48_12350, partial [Steroidobacteraceae bacterium]|nr:hypothetical protein [Steroidobacteraceae bacterium]
AFCPNAASSIRVSATQGFGQEVDHFKGLWAWLTAGRPCVAPCWRGVIVRAAGACMERSDMTAHAGCTLRTSVRYFLCLSD